MITIDHQNKINEFLDWVSEQKYYTKFVNIEINFWTHRDMRKRTEFTLFIENEPSVDFSSAESLIEALAVVKSFIELKIKLENLAHKS